MVRLRGQKVASITRQRVLLNVGKYQNRKDFRASFLLLTQAGTVFEQFA
jgi:translation elongation factor EF-Tu-like GTPase